MLESQNVIKQEEDAVEEVSGGKISSLLPFQMRTFMLTPPSPSDLITPRNAQNRGFHGYSEHSFRFFHDKHIFVRPTPGSAPLDFLSLSTRMR